MKTSFVHRRTMMETTATFLETNIAVWSAIPTITSTVAALNETLLKINASEEKQIDAKINYGELKTELKMKISKLADILNDLVEVYGEMENNAELSQRMSDSKSQLFRMNSNEFKLKIPTIIEAAKEHKDVLMSDYGMEESQIDELETNFASYLEIETKPRELRVKSGVATEEIEGYFKETSPILEKLDKLMKIYQTRNPEFYGGYVRSRIVVD